MRSARSLAALGALIAACGPRAAWMGDESYRIEQGLRADSLSKDGRAAEGMQLRGAPPLAAPTAAKGYTLDGGPPKGKASRKGHGSKKARRGGENGSPESAPERR